MDKQTEIIENNESCDVFYLDFVKAFTKIPKTWLLEKIKEKGVDGQVIAWIQAWLTGRSKQLG